MRRLVTTLAVAAALVGCGETSDFDLSTAGGEEPAPRIDPDNPNRIWGYEFTPEVAANADLVYGDMYLRPGIESYVVKAEHTDDVEFFPDGVAFFEGGALEDIERADVGDVVFSEEWVGRIVSIERGEIGAYVELEQFNLLEIVYGDFEIDFGEAISRGLGQEYGMWNPEEGWLPPERWPHLENEQLGDIEPLPNIDSELVTHRQAIGCSGSRPTTCEFFPSMNIAASYEISGDLTSKVEVTGSLRLPIDFDASFHAHYDSWVPFDQVEFPSGYECADGDDICIDQVLFLVAPRVEVEVGAKLDMKAKIVGWKVPDRSKNITRRQLPGIPVVAGVSIVPTLVLDKVAEIALNQQVILEGKLNVSGRAPVGFEYLRNRAAARRHCGTGIHCRSGFNGIPQRGVRGRSATFSATPSVDLTFDVASLTAKVGVDASIVLGVAPSVPLATIDGPKAGLEVAYEAKWTPVVWAANNSNPCLKMGLKATPYVGYTGAVRIRGVDRPILSVGEYKAELNPMEFGTQTFQEPCADFTAPQSIELRVTSNDPQGLGDVSGFEIDAVYVTRGNQTFYPTNQNKAARPDATCDDLGANVGVIGSSARFDFGRDLLPGDVVHVVRINDSQGGTCQMSGTADVWTIKDSGNVKIGTVQSGNTTFTL